MELPSRPNELLKKLQQADDYHAMKEYYYDRYMSQLRDKILALDNKPASAPVGRISSGQSNINHNKNVSNQSPSSKEKPIKGRKPFHKPIKLSTPKSSRLTMLEIEQKLIKAGHLKSDNDIAEFRSGVAAAEDLNQYAEDFVSKKTSLAAEKVSSSRKGLRPLSRITETRENSASKSRPATRGIPKKQMETNLNPLGGKKTVSPADIGRAAAAALEKRCPRMDVPDLHCLRPEAGDSEGEAEMALNALRGKRREEYTTQISYLRQMYQRAQANTAQAKRIIDARDDDILHHNSQLISDLTQICETISPKTRLRDEDGYIATGDYHDADSSTYDPALDLPDLSDAEGDNLSDIQEQRIANWRADNQQPVNISSSRKQFNMFTPIEEESFTPPLDKISVVDQSSEMRQEHYPDNALVPLHTESVDSAEEVDKQEEILAIESGETSSLPLNLNHIEAELRTIEAKSMSTYWSNYLKVGRSKFSKDS